MLEAIAELAAAQAPEILDFLGQIRARTTDQVMEAGSDVPPSPAFCNLSV